MWRKDQSGRGGLWGALVASRVGYFVEWIGVGALWLVCWMMSDRRRFMLSFVVAFCLGFYLYMRYYTCTRTAVSLYLVLIALGMAQRH